MYGGVAGEDGNRPPYADCEASLCDDGVETSGCGFLERGSASAKLYGLLLVGE